MKRTVKALTAVLAIAVLCLGVLSGCANNNIVGKWNQVSLLLGDTEIPVSSFGTDDSSMEFEFKADGTLDSYYNGEFSDTFSYTDNGDGSYTSNDRVFTVESGRLYMRYGGGGMIFERQ